MIEIGEKKKRDMMEFILRTNKLLQQHLLTEANRRLSGRKSAKGSHKRLLRDISGGQVHLIHTLERLLEFHPDGVSLNRLSEELGVSAASVSGMVNRLVDKGLIERRQSEQDRRQIRIFLSDAMQKEIELRKLKMRHGAMRIVSELDDEVVERWFEIMHEVAKKIST